MKFSIFLMVLLMPMLLQGQSWELSKEKNGISVYTMMEPGNNIKSYKGEAIINAPAEKVFAMLEDVHHTDWWDKSVTGMKVMKYEKNRMAQYYLIYDLSWPLDDRDLCVDVAVTVDEKAGVRKIIARPLPGLVPEVPGKVRIRNYRQSWTVITITPTRCRVILEGYADPGGSVPDWLSNMVIVDSPYNTISEVKRRNEQ